MIDPLKNLEAELAGMIPTRTAADLAERIETELKASKGRVSPWPDRFLLSAICSGALAACVIVTLLLMPQQQSAPALNRFQVTQSIGDGLLAFAQVDPAWADILK